VFLAGWLADWLADWLSMLKKDGLPLTGGTVCRFTKKKFLLGGRFLFYHFLKL